MKSPSIQCTHGLTVPSLLMADLVGSKLMLGSFIVDHIPPSRWSLILFGNDENAMLESVNSCKMLFCVFECVHCCRLAMFEVINSQVWKPRRALYNPDPAISRSGEWFCRTRLFTFLAWVFTFQARVFNF